MGARYIIALVLMIAVMIAWSLLFGNRLTPEQNDPSITEPSTPPSSVVPSTPSTEEERGSPNLDDIVFTPVQESPDDPKVNVRTPTYNITFNERLAIAKKWELAEKTEKGTARFAERSNGPKDLPLNLIPETALSCLALQFADSKLHLDSINAKWEADKSDIELADTEEKETLTFNTTIDDRLKVAKQFTFYPDAYFVDLALTFQNVSDTPLKLGGGQAANAQFYGYQLRWGPGINGDPLPHERRSGKRGRRTSEGAKTYIGTGKPKRELKEAQASATVLWAGLNSQYFSALMIPDPQLEAIYRLDTAKTENIKDIQIAAPTETAALLIPGFQLTPAQQETHVFRLYIGPNDDALLKQIEAPNASEVPLNLSKIIDFGFLAPLAWALLWIFKGLHTVFQNYGIAIILLTALIKVISYPLTRKAHLSMKKMQELQPQLTELKEKHRDNPQKLHRATMRIYKEQGVNPLGGCIPWLPQIPIFWALFALLGSAVELRGAPFLFWIDDLSAPDTLYELPFTIPLIFMEIDAIRFLPILNGVTAWLQQKFVGGMTATPTTSSTQMKIMQFMPLIFVFIFYNWASGFVLYWLCNNVLTVAQQYLQTRTSQTSESDK